MWAKAVKFTVTTEDGHEYTLEGVGRFEVGVTTQKREEPNPDPHKRNKVHTDDVGQAAVFMAVSPEAAREVSTHYAEESLKRARAAGVRVPTAEEAMQ